MANKELCGWEQVRSQVEDTTPAVHQQELGWPNSGRAVVASVELEEELLFTAIFSEVLRGESFGGWFWFEVQECSCGDK